MRVLIAEDWLERRVAEAIARGLRRAAPAVDVANDGGSALHRARVHPYSRCGPPWPSGTATTWSRALSAEQPATKVLMLTGATRWRTWSRPVPRRRRLPGKPFRFASWSRACARSATERERLPCSGGTSRSTRRAAQASRAGRPLDLVPKELAVLQQLMAARGAAVSTERLLAAAWDEQR